MDRGYPTLVRERISPPVVACRLKLVGSVGVEVGLHLEQRRLTQKFTIREPEQHRMRKILFEIPARIVDFGNRVCRASDKFLVQSGGADGR